MDLVVFDPGHPNRLYDVVVTNPVTAAVSRSGTTNLRAAWTQQRTKEKRYRVAATEAGMLLHGLAIEVYGRWSDDFSNMFNHFITLGTANSNIPWAILANYWRRWISVCLQSGVANANVCSELTGSQRGHWVQEGCTPARGKHSFRA
jgi:hypothetical protein